MTQEPDGRVQILPSSGQLSGLQQVTKLCASGWPATKNSCSQSYYEDETLTRLSENSLHRRCCGAVGKLLPLFVNPSSGVRLASGDRGVCAL